jgi:hypothetical protein
MAVDQREEKREGETVRRSTLVVTNLIKLAGLGLAIREMLNPQRDPVVIAACVVMMSGVQGVEQALVVFFDKFFGGGVK